MNRTDKQGNKLMIGNSGIYLKLKKENKMKEIFKIRGTTVEKYTAKKNIMRAVGENGAIGFNYNALKILKERMRIKKITVRVGGQTPIAVPIQKIFDKGKFLHFLEGGFELQLFFPMEFLYD